MGMYMSSMGKGMATTQMVSLLMGTFYKQFVVNEIENFEDFHKAILDIFSSVNSALPGKHYDVPPRKELEECFKEWKEAQEPKRRKEIFTEFMKTKVHLNKLDYSTMITGMVTPPVAMAAKRGGESLPQLRIIKAIPDVVFVPTATIVALVTVKLSRRIFQKNTVLETGPIVAPPSLVIPAQVPEPPPERAGTPVFEQSSETGKWHSVIH